MPDATGLELVAQRVRDNVAEDAVVDTDFSHGHATLEVKSEAVHDVLAWLRDRDDAPYGFLSSLLIRPYTRVTRGDTENAQTGETWLQWVQLWEEPATEI